MKIASLRGIAALTAAAYAVLSPVCVSQTASARANDALLDLLVFGVAGPIRAGAYPQGVRGELEGYLKRYQAYRPARARPVIPGVTAGEAKMVYAARTGYERRLAAASPAPAAPRLAREYVDKLRPCYEWEGFHDCPEREAEFAAKYLEANPGGPFKDYLPLLAAHRWLCAAEGYDYEKHAEEAARSRREFERTLATARQSPSPLIRLAAGRLAERRSCQSRP
jgi:hypothetical protein